VDKKINHIVQAFINPVNKPKL